MKKVTYILIAIYILSISACGGDKADEVNTDVVIEKPSLKGFEELNLADWGYNLTIMFPEAEVNGVPIVTLTERGAL